jgi:sarcosine oxidase subunit beta
MAGVDLPVSPVRRQWVTTTPLPAIPEDFPFVIDFAQSLYFHREGPGLLTGMSNRDQLPGFDQRIDTDWEATHLEAAADRLPLLEEAGIVARAAGFYEVTPDAHPLIGPTPVGGFYVAAGFSGHGFMHAPAAGLLLAEMLLDGEAHSLDISSLSPGRFSGVAPAPEYSVV